MIGRGIRYFAGSMPLARAVRGELLVPVYPDDVSEKGR